MIFASLAAAIYGWAATAYHRRWDRRGGTKVGVPVISVGNITVGGNGKTPFVIELVRQLEQHFGDLCEPNRIAVLSRGYGRKSSAMTIVESGRSWQECGDEPLLIKRACPNALVISYAKRVVSARQAIDKFGARLILLDDGFQHRQLARDFDLVLLDSEEPFGNGKLLPAGTLRERPDALVRATHLFQVGESSNGRMAVERFGKQLGQVAIVPPILPGLEGKPLGLLTGVARPERVRSSLEKAGIRVVFHRAFRDHHGFLPAELDSVHRAAERAGAVAVLTTSKDRARISSWDGGLPLVEIPHTLRITGLESLFTQLERLRADRLQ